jgi:hypothetical protein
MKEGEELVVEVGLTTSSPASEEPIEDEVDDQSGEQTESEDGGQPNPRVGSKEGVELGQVGHVRIVV